LGLKVPWIKITMIYWHAVHHESKNKLLYLLYLRQYWLLTGRYHAERGM